ncbi:MAG: alanine-glyoxylate transaminase / serine-glyoxylate transaminase / serine-pyruvate transaminase [Gaiellales bacterium]|jgi:alanine-glyoxylate transaminase/serine-glyoxylate transaminase/serine-pyruvate transaminase|nr:alanine-glyoxylate transaminase / serine-glyoxylate transaminase / serine-pyruvate transaminase [Gaiellales bacterium]
MNAPLEPLSPPERLLCGPGPSNVHPRVLEAMQHPMLGHLDPEFHLILERLVDMLQRAYRRSDGLTLALSASGTSGMEAGIASLSEPGDTVVIGTCGFFGNRMVEMARRQGLNVLEVRAPYGKAVPNEQILEQVAAHPETRLVCVVHAETSTGVAHPLAELAAELRDGDTLLMADCVTSLGGMRLEAQAWGVDYCYSCSQKCLGAPPGMSPVSLSPRAMERIRERRTPVPFSFDFEALERYWIARPATYHHTTPNIQYYALYEGLRLALEEGLETRWQRHADAGAHLQAGLRERGYELLADPDVQLPQLSAVRVPEGVDGKETQMRLLTEHNVEVGGGLGPDAPPIWRIGMMGTNAHRETADRVLAALDAVLTHPRARVSAGSA